MHDPECGGSRVPMMFSILLLLVAGSFAYIEYGARVAAEKDLDEMLAAASGTSSPSKAKKSDAIQYITKARGIYARQKDRLEEIREVTGGDDEAAPELVVDPAKLRAVRTRFLEMLDHGEFAREIPFERGMVLIRFGGTSDLRGARPDLSNIVDFVAIPAMRRMMAAIERYRDACSDALAAKDAAEASHKSVLAAKEAAVAALTAERDDWRKRAEQASAELQVLKQR